MADHLLSVLYAFVVYCAFMTTLRSQDRFFLYLGVLTLGGTILLSSFIKGA